MLQGIPRMSAIKLSPNNPCDDMRYAHNPINIPAKRRPSLETIWEKYIKSMQVFDRHSAMLSNAAGNAPQPNG